MRRLCLVDNFWLLQVAIIDVIVIDGIGGAGLAAAAAAAAHWRINNGYKLSRQCVLRCKWR